MAYLKILLILIFSTSCYACPEFSHEWNPDAIVEAIVLIVKDSNGNILVDGGSVIVIKYLPVRVLPLP